MRTQGNNMLTIVTLTLLYLYYASGSASQYVTDACTTKAIKNATLYDGYCAFEWFSGAAYPRVVRVASNNDVIYTDYIKKSIFVLWEENGVVRNGTLATCCIGLGHGLAIQGPYLYASSANVVYRWPYTPGNRTVLNRRQTVVTNICPPARCYDHLSRGLAFDSNGLLYVQSGSGSNVDPDATKSMIRQFNISKISAGGLPWTTGTVYAGGLRNEVGMRFDADGVLWGVENGRDDLTRPDLGDISQQNPSEEMNKFSIPGQFYGYPYCWSEYNVTSTPDLPRGTQWADPKFWMDGNHTDAWCRNTSNVVQPVYNFDGHKAPLDLIFNNGQTSFASDPSIGAGHAFVAFHGSVHRKIPVGYSVNLVKIQNGLPTAEIPFFKYSGPGSTGPKWPYRPVGLAWYKCGGQHTCLLVTSGGGVRGTIVALIKNE